MAEVLVPNNIKIQKAFDISIAIDFGTDGMGVAYALPNSNKIHVHDKWRSRSTKYSTIVKPKTIILFDENFDVVSIGLDAKNTYITTPNQRDKWMLFERFKMSLFEDNFNDMLKEDNNEEKTINLKQIGIKDELTATNGKKCSSEKVFVAAFKYVNDLCKTYLIKQGMKDINNNIQWIITVPAIWNDTAKNKMKLWATTAGLVNEQLNNQCKIVYEPDCASLAIQYHMKDASSVQYDKDRKKKKKKDKNNKNDDIKVMMNDEADLYDDVYKLENGDKYILIDAGGGTVDIACHEVIDEFGVKEIYHPSGGKWGSMYIDDQYVELLETMFSKQWINEFKREENNGYVKLIHHFQDSKQTFYARNNGSHKHRVELPFEFISFIGKKLAEKYKQCPQLTVNKRPKDDASDDESEQVTSSNVGKDHKYIETFIKNTKIDNTHNLLDFDGDYLSIDNKIWQKMFDYVTNPLIRHVGSLLSNVPLLMSPKLKYICLVGGLSCNRYFQKRIKKEFGLRSRYKLDIIIPHKPILSVVEGAALLGITQNFVRSRRLQYTYGVVLNKPKRIAVRDEVPDEYIEKHEFYNELDGKHYVAGCIKIIALKNEEVQLYGNEVKAIGTRRMNTKISLVKRQIFSSDMEEPTTIEDGRVIGTMNIKFAEQDEENMEIMSEFHFSETMLKIIAYPKNRPNKKYKSEINYDTL